MWQVIIFAEFNFPQITMEFKKLYFFQVGDWEAKIKISWLTLVKLSLNYCISHSLFPVLFPILQSVSSFSTSVLALNVPHSLWILYPWCIFSLLFDLLNLSVLPTPSAVLNVTVDVFHVVNWMTFNTPLQWQFLKVFSEYEYLIFNVCSCVCVCVSVCMLLQGSRIVKWMLMRTSLCYINLSSFSYSIHGKKSFYIIDLQGPWPLYGKSVSALWLKSPKLWFYKSLTQ